MVGRSLGASSEVSSSQGGMGDSWGEDSGRGLLARRAIPQDAILVRLPVRLCMTNALKVPASTTWLNALK